MADEKFANNARTTLTAAIVTTPAAGTSEAWAVASTGGRFPTGGQFRAVIVPAAGVDADPELVIVTAINDATHFQVTRGAEGSTVKVHANGDTLAVVVTLGSLLVLTAPGRMFGWASFR